MCWFAHDLEPFALKAIFRKRVSLLALLVGSISPDFFTKIFIQFHILPVYQHRHPPIGITHTPFFGLVCALLLYLLLRRLGREGAATASCSFLVGQWSHVLFDMFDSSGCMVLFPLSTSLYSFGIWQYGAQLGFWGDLFVFYHSPALLLESLWLIYVWGKGWRLGTFERFEREILGEEGWAKSLSGAKGKIRRLGDLIWIFCFFYFLGGLRMPGWILFVWLAYSPSPEASELASRSWASSLFHHPLALTLTMLPVFSLVFLTLWRWAGSGYRSPLLSVPLFLLLLLLPFQPSEPVTAVLSNVLVLLGSVAFRWELSRKG